MAGGESKYPGVPMQIVGTVDNVVVVIDEALEEVVATLEGIKYDHMAIVSVCGPLRTGKSFILDMFIKYLSTCETNPQVNEDATDTTWLTGDDVEKEDAGLFKWRASKDRTTEGIWIYSRPFVLLQDDGSRLAIVLMDTQGLFDHETDKQTNNTVFGLSTLLSSLQILNVQNRIQEDTLEVLHMFTEFCHTALNKFLMTDTGDTKSEYGKFQTLEFLVRDWPSFDDPDDVARCEQDAKDYLQECLSKRAFDDGGSRERIKESYDDVRCFMLPHPGKAMTRITWDGSIAAIDQDFSDMANRYVRRVFNENLPRKRSLTPNVAMSPQVFKHSVHALVEAFASDETPKAESVVKSLSNSVNIQARESALAKYRSLMGEVGMGYVDEEELKEKHATALSEAMDTFRRIATFGDEEDKEKTKDVLQEEVSKEFKGVVEVNMLKMGKLLSRFTPYVLAAVVAFAADWFSDYACDWWLEGCNDLSALLWWGYVAVFLFIAYQVFDLYSTKGSVVVVQSLTGLGGDCMAYASQLYEAGDAKLKILIGLTPPPKATSQSKKCD